MSAHTAAARGQRAAEAMMIDTCQLVRPSATATTDPTTGAVSHPETTKYTGWCRIRPNLHGGDAEVGGVRVQLLSHLVSVPISVTDVAPDDVVIVTASVDASLVGKRLRVRTVSRGTDLTARRLGCEEVA